MTAAQRALEQLGANAGDVVRARMFVTDIARWEDYGRAHADFFGEHRAATTMVEVRKLIRDDMLVEIELDAVLLRAEWTAGDRHTRALAQVCRDDVHVATRSTAG